MSYRSLISTCVFGAMLVASGCASSGETKTDPPECEGEKCDEPGTTAEQQCRDECQGSSDADCFQTCRDGKAVQHCEARRSDALSSAQKAFTPNEVRWSCADVEGVNTNGGDDRGQEYCEYFAVVQPPPEVEGGALPRTTTKGRGSSGLSIELTEDQIFALEDEPDAIIGQCVFTSWHSDIQQPLDVCGESEAGCPSLSIWDGAKLPGYANEARSLDYPLTGDNIRMLLGVNSNPAASDLFEKCLGGAPEKEYEGVDMDDHYMRGCLKTYELFTTEWRRSDPTVCVAGLRLAECGCAIDANGSGTLDEGDIQDVKAISLAVVPPQPDANGEIQFRGFHLGTWSGRSELPTGCRHVETGDEGTETLVACDLTASDLLSASNDVKGKCREKYGENVVVHVPGHLNIQDAVVCKPDLSKPHTADCGAMPWVVGDENGAAAE